MFKEVLRHRFTLQQQFSIMQLFLGGKSVQVQTAVAGTQIGRRGITVTERVALRAAKAVQPPLGGTEVAVLMRRVGGQKMPIENVRAEAENIRRTPWNDLGIDPFVDEF